MSVAVATFEGICTGQSMGIPELDNIMATVLISYKTKLSTCGGLFTELKLPTLLCNKPIIFKFRSTLEPHYLKLFCV